MMPNIGPLEILVVLIIALVVFGPKRLPELGASLGKGIRDFSTGLKGEQQDAIAAPPGGEASATRSREGEAQS